MRWFVLRVKGKRIPLILEALGEQAWRPVEKRWTKPARKHKPVLSEVPMIPGWIFCHEELYGKWPELEGVYGALKFGRLGVLWVDEADLQGLRDAEEAANAEKSPQISPETPVRPRPKVGSIVQVQGILNGVSGLLEGYSKDGLALIRLNGLIFKVSHCLLREHGV